jgi:LysR family transcriptional regulator for bpeEF and oprC
METISTKRNKMDKLWAMTVFVRVAECSSFSRAAESLDLANATVTACVRNLEQSLGVTLIHRDTRRLHLTEQGEKYLESAREILRAVDDAEIEVRSQLGELRGALVVETPISFGHAFLCPALNGFAERHPGISTMVTLTNQPHNLIEKAIDVAIRMDRVEDAGLIARPIYEAHYIVCATPEVAAGLPEHPADLNRRDCLGVLAEERRTSNPWVLTRGDENVAVQPSGTLHFNSNDAVVNAALHGAGVIHVLDIFVLRAIEQGTLVPVYTDWATRCRTFYSVTTRARNDSAKVRAFTDFLSEVIDSERKPSTFRAVEVRPLGKR